MAESGTRMSSWRWVAMATAIMLAGSAVWVTLLDHGVTVSEPPPFTTGTDAELEAWYAWVTTTLPQERLAHLLLGLSLIGVGLLALRAASPTWGSRAGAVAVAGAAAIWCLADLMEAGGRRAVEVLVATENPIGSVTAVAVTVDVTTLWLEAGASIMVGVGAAVMAHGFLQVPRTRRLGLLSVLVGLAGVVFGLLTVVPDVDTTIAGVALGVVLMPVWVVWLGRVVPPSPVAAADRAAVTRVTVGS